MTHSLRILRVLEGRGVVPHKLLLLPKIDFRNFYICVPKEVVIAGYFAIVEIKWGRSILPGRAVRRSCVFM